MKTLLIILIILALIAIPMLFFMFYGMGSIKKMVISEIDFSKIKDGTYKGDFKKGRWGYQLEITVKNGKITNINNLTQGWQAEAFKEWNKQMTDELLKKQKLPFDAVAGATIHTKAFMKTVENAFSSEINH